MVAHTPGLSMSITTAVKRALAAPLYIAIAWNAGIDQAQTLTVANFGGANAAAQQLAFYTPFEATTKGAKVRGVEYTGDLAQVKAMVERGAAQWDVV